VEDDPWAGPEGVTGVETYMDFSSDEDVGFVIAVADLEGFEYGGEVKGVVNGVGVRL